jgi:hypothetical protein
MRYWTDEPAKIIPIPNATGNEGVISPIPNATGNEDIKMVPLYASNALNSSASNNEDPYDSIMNILAKHSDKNFVQRILYPKDFPTLGLGGQDWGTHLMSYSTDDNGKAFLYPSIIQDPDSKELRLLKGREALHYAIKTGEYIPFDSAKDAEWFGNNYKLGWDQKAATNALAEKPNYSKMVER